jgi:hypothetical protein
MDIVNRLSPLTAGFIVLTSRDSNHVFSQRSIGQHNTNPKNAFVEREIINPLDYSLGHIQL